MLASSVDTAPYIALDKAFPSITAYPDIIKVSAAKALPYLVSVGNLLYGVSGCSAGACWNVPVPRWRYPCDTHFHQGAGCRDQPEESPTKQP